MVGENKGDRSVFPPGVDKGLPPIAMADDHLEVEKMNPLGGSDDKVNRRRKQASAEVVKVTDKDQVTPKKSRFIWTRTVHNCFLDAVKQLGFTKAVPTKILELMNVEDLTRENVASHLQKYRLQIKKRAQERAQAHAASENVAKAVYPHMSGIPQQPWVLPNTMQGINMDCNCLEGSRLAPSFTNHNLNMSQAFPTVQEVYRTPFKDLFDEGVDRMSSVRLVHGLYDSNDPPGYNYSSLAPKPLVDSYAHNLMDRHDTTLVPQYDRRNELSLQNIISPSVPQYDQRDELSLQGLISPSFVPQCDRRDELSLQNIISPSVPQYDQRDELSLQGLIGPSVVPQCDRCDELPLQGLISPSFVPQYDRVANQGIISPLLGQTMEGLGVGVPRTPEAIGGLIGMKFEGIGAGMTRPPTGVLGMKVEGLGLGVPRPLTGGLVGGVTHLPEAGLAGMKVIGHGLGVPRLPEATRGHVGMKVEGDVTLLRGGPGMKVKGHVPCLPAGVKDFGAGVTHLPGATGSGVSGPPEASGGLAGMDDFQLGLDQTFEIDRGIESASDLSDFGMNTKGDVDGKSLDVLFWR